MTEWTIQILCTLRFESPLLSLSVCKELGSYLLEQCAFKKNPDPKIFKGVFDDVKWKSSEGTEAFVIEVETIDNEYYGINAGSTYKLVYISTICSESKQEEGGNTEGDIALVITPNFTFLKSTPEKRNDPPKYFSIYVKFPLISQQ